MSFIGELKRRNVIRIAIAYAIVAWLMIQIVGEIVEPLQLPAWTPALVIVLLGVGFPVALIFAWAFELTPEGLRREKDVDPGRSTTRQTGRKLDLAIIIVLVLALAYLAWDKFVLSPGQPSASAEAVVADSAGLSVGPDSRSIAILPFQNMSRDEANDPFTIGIHDDLLTHLSKIGSIRTISRTSVLQYRDTTKTIPQIAAELGVATILEGGVQRAGDRVRINVQLIDAATDQHLWAETYDRQLTAANIFNIQSDIAKAIASALQAKLSPDDQQRIETVPTENLAALEAYFLGRQSMSRRTSDSLAAAVDNFNTAIELDPQFALAYVGLADSLALQVEYSGMPADQNFALALQMANAALEIDRRSGEAFTSLAYIYMIQWDRDAAGDAFQRALQLNPNYVPARHWYSIFLRQYGDYEAGLEQIGKAIQLDPLSWVLQANLGTVLFELGSPEGALTQYRKVAKMAPARSSGHLSAAEIYWTSLGQLDVAMTFLNRALELDPDDIKANAFKGLMYLDLGADLQAEHYISRALELGPESGMANWAMEMLLLYWGKYARSAEFSNRILGQDPKWPLSLAILRNRDLEASRPGNARTRYARHYPALFADQPRIDRANVDAAIDLALVLSKLGAPDRAQLLLSSAMDYADATSMPRLHWFSMAYGLPHQVQIYALQGRSAEALAALRQTIDAGNRGLLWYWLDHDPNLASIRDAPEFQALKEEIRLDMATQRQRIAES